mgnify:CR=1 FL=1
MLHLPKSELNKTLKQIIQSFKTGETQLLEVPSPIVQSGAVLIQTTESLVSLGTERMLVTFGKSNILSKAKQQPDKVKQVVNKIKSEGLITTLNSVSNKLEQPLPLRSYLPLRNQYQRVLFLFFFHLHNFLEPLITLFL